MEDAIGHDPDSFVEKFSSPNHNKSRRMIPEREQDFLSPPTRGEPFLKPRKPKPRRTSEQLLQSPTTRPVFVTNVETHAHAHDDYNVEHESDPPSEKYKKKRSVHTHSKGNQIRIPADTPPPRRDSSVGEDDGSLKSVESADKEKAPEDEYLTITMPSTPSERRGSDNHTKNLENNPNFSERGTEAKSSFIRKWSKKVTESLTRSISQDKGEISDGEALEMKETKVTQVQGISSKRLKHQMTKMKRSKQKDVEVKERKNDIEITRSPITLTASNKRNLRRREKAGEFKPDQKILGVKIHGTDMLPSDSNICHPLVRLTAMSQDGNFLSRKIDGEEIVLEQSLTKPFDLDTIGFNHLLPKWDEILYIKESMEKLLSPETRAILFFEVMDFLPMFHPSLRKASKSKPSSDLGWHKIGWAFIKPLGGDGTKYVNRKLRLQLYRPEVRNGETVYDWWKSKKCQRLNSTLYVTLKGILPPELMSPKESLEVLFKMNKEELTEALIEGQIAGHQPKEKLVNVKKIQQWNRLPGQTCKVPNKLIHSLPATEIDWLNLRVVGNVYCVKFSPCGLLLAAGLNARNYNVTLLFEIPSGKLVKSLRGHHGLIYDLDWKILSQSEQNIVSYYALATASADSTAMVWGIDVLKMNTRSLAILLHPSYVYSLEFYPINGCRLATGCFDNVIRIWDISTSKSNNASLEQSAPLWLLDGHYSHVNSLRFTPNGDFLVSGDGRGTLIKWIYNSHHQAPKFDREISLSSTAIISISVFPNGRKMLVQLRKNSLKILDMDTLLVLINFEGLKNERFRLSSTLSPCGNLVLSGSEDSYLYVWDADTGRLLTKIQSPAANSLISCVSYHPFDHYVATGLFSSSNEPHPILIYTHEYPKSISIRTVANLRKAFGSSRTSEDNNVLGKSNSAEKFRSILQKLDEVTGGVPPQVAMASVATQLMKTRQETHETN